jgi:hypothetical protein
VGERAILKAGHQIIMAAIPQRTATCQIAFHTDAVGFDDVLAVGLGIERWQLTVPIDDLGPLTRCAHTNDTSRLRAGGLSRWFDRPFLWMPTGSRHRWLRLGWWRRRHWMGW